MSTTDLTYQAKIERALSRLGMNGTAGPDTSNTGAFLNDYFLWSSVKKYAEKKFELAEEQLLASGIIEKPIDTLEPGNHILLESECFVLTADVTKPIKQMSKDTLAELFEKSKYKVPRSTTVDFMEKAKVPTKSRVTKRIAER